MYWFLNSSVTWFCLHVGKIKWIWGLLKGNMWQSSEKIYANTQHFGGRNPLGKWCAIKVTSFLRWMCFCSCATFSQLMVHKTLYITCYNKSTLFQMLNLTSDKMVQKFQHHRMSKFYMPFKMAWSLLLWLKTVSYYKYTKNSVLRTSF